MKAKDGPVLPFPKTAGPFLGTRAETFGERVRLVIGHDQADLAPEATEFSAV